MGWLQRLFGQKPPPRAPGQVSPLLAKMQAKALPCLRLVPVDAPSHSHIGGLPGCALGRDWPIRQGRPLDFVAQIDLAAARAAGGPDWLPARGFLLFFFDPEQPWGFDPEDHDAWAIIHTAGGGASGGGFATYPMAPKQLVPAVSLPDPAHFPAEFSAATDAESDEASALQGPDGTMHQIGGYPMSVQYDAIFEECQLCSNGIYTGKGVNEAVRAKAAALPGADEWRLLLQLDSDEDAHMAWGDFGRLYFCIRETDARQGDFSRVWMILQTT